MSREWKVFDDVCPELSEYLEDLPDIPWYIWRVSPLPRAWIDTIMLPWPYLRPVRRPRWGALWANMYLPGTPDDGTALDRALDKWMTTQTFYEGSGDASIGSMFAVETTLSGPWTGRPAANDHVFLMTPPVDRFCDLLAAFDHVPDEIKPLDFWICRDVYEETGEILHGSPVDDANLNIVPRERFARHTTPEASVLAQPRFEEYLSFVMAALDAYLVKGEPDPRFVQRAGRLR